jgi:hypothetical protein
MTGTDLVERDLRLDLFRALSLWLLFLQQLPAGSARLLHIRSYGFSDATAIFVFVFGYTAGFVYGQVMRDRGVLVGTAQILRRVGQVYAAYVLLLPFYVWELGVAGQGNPIYVEHTNVLDLLLHPGLTLAEGLFLQFQLTHLAPLALYAVLLLAFAPILWLLLRSPILALAGSAILYTWSRRYGWNVPAFPAGTWRLNPLAWQFLFVLAAWLGVGGGPRRASTTVVMCAAAYLTLGLVLTIAPWAPTIATEMPAWLNDAVSPINRTNADPAMLGHVLCMAVLAVRLVPVDCYLLASGLLRPVLLCGRYPLSTFSLGVFLAIASRAVCPRFGSGVIVCAVFATVGIALMLAQSLLLAWFDKMSADDGYGPSGPARGRITG